MTSARLLMAFTAIAAVAIVRITPAGADDTDALIKEVAKLRGLSVKRAIPVVDIDEAGLRDRLVARLAAERDASASEGEQLALERWGLVPHGLDVHALLIDLLVEQVAGMYDPADGKMYLTDAAHASPVMLAHEIEHALADQHFDLTRLMKVPADDADARLARQALIEGDGEVTSFELTLAQQGVAPPWGKPDATELLVHTMEASDGGALAKAPLVVRDWLLFPYTRGLRFVAALRARSPWKKVDEAFKRPPRSTEQVMHPELYLADDRPIAVTAKTPDSLSGWRTVHSTVWGEAGWSVLLRQLGISVDRADEAAAGWGGDRVEVYGRAGSDGRDAVGVALTAWDEEVDAVEFQDAVRDAVDQLITGTIVEDGGGRTVWLGIDLRVSIVERRDQQVLVVVGAPLSARSTIADEVWKRWKVKS